MNDGFVKVAVASVPLRVADCAYNAQQCIAAVLRAKSLGARILVLPELCLTGYSCNDLFGQETLRHKALTALVQVAEATAGADALTFVGLPFAWNGRLYNCAAALYNGKVLALIPKTHIPNYGEFYEARYFTPAPPTMGQASGFWSRGQAVPFGGNVLFTHPELPEFSVGCEICEDLWAPRQPSQDLALAGATIIVNLSASPAVIGKGSYRRDLVAGQSARLMCGYLYACACCQESTQDLVYAGHNLIAENGVVLAESTTMEPDLLVSELDVRHLITERTRQSTHCFSQPEQLLELPLDFPIESTSITRTIDPHPFVPANTAGRQSRCEEILSIQAAGLAKRLDHTQAKTALVGLSGGLDSTLALLVAVRAMELLGKPASAVLGVTMPGFGTTDRTYRNALDLMEALGVTRREISIADACVQHMADIGHDPSVHDITYENTQARERTQILFDLANKEGCLLVGTGDLSELAMGWCTYNGDHMSMYGVNASVPKTLVRYLVDYVAGELGGRTEEILRDVLDTPVSPELLPPDANGKIAQKTEEKIGPYELHDFFLYHFVRFGFDREKLAMLAEKAFDGQYDRPTIDRWLTEFLRRFFISQFKRSCIPDSPKVGSVSLSPRGDWRMPSDAAMQAFLQPDERI